MPEGARPPAVLGRRVGVPAGDAVARLLLEGEQALAQQRPQAVRLGVLRAEARREGVERRVLHRAVAGRWGRGGAGDPRLRLGDRRLDAWRARR